MALPDEELRLIGILRDETETLSATLSTQHTLRATIGATGSFPPYNGDYTVSPDFDGTVLNTRGKVLHDDVTVEPILVSRTTNLSGGTTVYIGGVIENA